MKLHELIEADGERSTEDGEHSTDDPITFFGDVGQRCGPYLKEAGNLWGQVYRGVHIARYNFIEKQSRLQGRRPLSTDQDIHNGINEIFKDKYGYPFRNGVFASGNMKTVGQYGHNIFHIFPMGDFKYLWSPNIPDLYEVIESLKQQGMGTNETLAEIRQEKFRTDNLQAAIDSGNEIMFWCSGYLGARQRYLIQSEINIKNQPFPTFYNNLQQTGTQNETT